MESRDEGGEGGEESEGAEVNNKGHSEMSNATQAYWYERGSRELNVCEDYEILHGPDGFECVITEPEDRTFGRDFKNAILRLNEQHAELERLRRIERHYDDLHAAGVDNWEGYRSSYKTSDE